MMMFSGSVKLMVAPKEEPAAKKATLKIEGLQVSSELCPFMGQGPRRIESPTQGPKQTAFFRALTNQKRKLSQNKLENSTTF